MKWQQENAWIDSLISEEEPSSSQALTQNIEVEEYTTEFLQDLQLVFLNFTEIFNMKKKDLGALKIQALRVYKIKNNKSDFLLFRNGYHLIFSRKAPGLIRIRFSKDSEEKGLIQKDTFLQSCFTNSMSPVRWKHQDYEGFMEIHSLARYYMKLFTKISAIPQSAH